jgi:hypothetical protein
MKFAYADPPYLGCGKLYKEHHPDALNWDSLNTHRDLIARLESEYPDGWAMSLSSPSLQAILPMCPYTVRVGGWFKPFAIFKPSVNPAYAWEPVIFNGGRPYERSDATVRDWVAASVTLKRGLTGAKPRDFCRWMFGLLNAQPGDTLDDLFPGTGAVGAAWAEWVGEKSPLPQLPLEAAQ